MANLFRDNPAISPGESTFIDKRVPLNIFKVLKEYLTSETYAVDTKFESVVEKR